MKKILAKQIWVLSAIAVAFFVSVGGAYAKPNAAANTTAACDDGNCACDFGPAIPGVTWHTTINECATLSAGNCWNGNNGNINGCKYICAKRVDNHWTTWYHSINCDTNCSCPATTVNQGATCTFQSSTCTTTTENICTGQCLKLGDEIVSPGNPPVPVSLSGSCMPKP